MKIINKKILKYRKAPYPKSCVTCGWRDIFFNDACRLLNNKINLTYVCNSWKKYRE
jgi:hypothetical protein